MEQCKCGSKRVMQVSAKCNDLCSVTIGHDHINNYSEVPSNINIGAGDYIILMICADCGHLFGNWPLPDIIEIRKSQITDDNESTNIPFIKDGHLIPNTGDKYSDSENDDSENDDESDDGSTEDYTVNPITAIGSCFSALTLDSESEEECVEGSEEEIDYMNRHVFSTGHNNWRTFETLHQFEDLK